MSDPTPTPTTPAVTARSAREVIAEHLAALESWARNVVFERSHDPMKAMAEDRDYRDEPRALGRTALALRALLDAPPGSVERLCEAALAIKTDARRLLESQPFCEIAEPNGGPMEMLDGRIVQMENALAAVRASPEAIGAGAGGRAAEAINTAGRIVREAEAERDAARKTVNVMQAALEKASEECGALKADLAAARGEVERLKRLVSQLSPMVQDWRRMESPPVSEAPISERARLVYEGAMRLAIADAACEQYPTTAWLNTEPDGEARTSKINEYARDAADILAASERAAKGEGST